jgi:hypothetical protein
LGTGFTVIDITRSKQDTQEFAPVIDDQVQFEAIKPTGGGLAPFCQASKHLVRANPLVETDFQGSGIDEGDPAAVAQAELSGSKHTVE